MKHLSSNLGFIFYDALLNDLAKFFPDHHDEFEKMKAMNKRLSDRIAEYKESREIQKLDAKRRDIESEIKKRSGKTA